MRRFINHCQLMAWLLGSCVCFFGCAAKSIPFYGKPSLPEFVYKAPEKNEYKEAMVGVFRFTTGSYSNDIGIVAAESLYQALLEKKVFSEIQQATEIKNTSLENQFAFAREKGFELIITGKILYYIDGSRSQPSRVEQEIKAYDVSSQKLVWYAKTTNSDEPDLEKDLIIYRKAGAPARPVSELMNESIEKMANLFLE
jgi:hypothetical protein